MRRTVGFAILFATCLLAWTQGVYAQGVGAMRKKIEMSMAVTGEITVSEHGGVIAHTLDRTDELPPGVVAFLQQQITAWEFKPLQHEGRPVRARNKMRVLLVAKKQDTGGYEMRVQAASFHAFRTAEESSSDNGRMMPPRYPAAMARAGASGSVYLILKVGRDGRVEEAFAEQVNLRILATAPEMERMRQSFAASAVQAARDWSFTPPSQVDSGAAEYWTMRVPVDYTMGRMEPRYGRWVAYVPGPRTTADWVDAELTQSSPEALANGMVGVLDRHALRLLTPLAGEG